MEERSMQCSTKLEQIDSKGAFSFTFENQCWADSKFKKQIDSLFCSRLTAAAISTRHYAPSLEFQLYWATYISIILVITLFDIGLYFYLLVILGSWIFIRSFQFLYFLENSSYFDNLSSFSRLLKVALSGAFFFKAHAK